MKLHDLNIKILTVHSSSTIRQLINSELRAKGYQDVTGAPDLQTVVEIMETDVVNWLITPVIMDDRLNVFQILKLATENPAMMDMRVSFLVEPSISPHFISKAFDLGLLSFHKKMQTKIDVELELNELLAINTACQQEQSLLAATYLRRLLLEHQRYPELLAFEKALFHLHTGHFQLVLAMAEAHLLNQQFEVAKQLALRALLVVPDLKTPLDALFERYQASLGATHAPPTAGGQDLLGIKTCLLVEPHAATRAEIERLLLQLGIEQVTPFSEADAALQWLKLGNKPELVLFEWRLKQVPGPIFVQRVREFLGYGKPVTVMNKDLTDRDMPILREMGVTDRIRKPIEPQKFLQEIIWVIHQDRAPSEPFIILQKVRQAMQDQDFERLAAYTKRYMDSGKTTDTDKTLLQAELAYFRGHYSNAKTFAMAALKIGPTTVDMLNLLGKSLMKLRDFASALVCLENAEVVSPKNLRRICDIAEVHLEMGNDEAYQKQIVAAKALDPDNQAVAEVETKGALVHGDGLKARSLMQKLGSLINIVSFTNNRAISLIRCDRFADGRSLYEEAIQAVPDNNVEVLAVLHYNLGLAQVRSQQLAEAQINLDRAAELNVEKIQAKVVSLRKRLHRALRSHVSLELVAEHPQQLGESIAPPTDPAKDYDDLMMALKIGPGDIGCHKIYSEQAINSQLREMIDRPLKFRRLSKTTRAPVKVS